VDETCEEGAEREGERGQMKRRNGGGDGGDEAETTSERRFALAFKSPKLSLSEPTLHTFWR
jgi:hypothetical protein